MLLVSNLLIMPLFSLVDIKATFVCHAILQTHKHKLINIVNKNVSINVDKHDVVTSGHAIRRNDLNLERYVITSSGAAWQR